MRIRLGADEANTGLPKVPELIRFLLFDQYGMYCGKRDVTFQSALG